MFAQRAAAQFGGCGSPAQYHAQRFLRDASQRRFIGSPLPMFHRVVEHQFVEQEAPHQARQQKRCLCESPQNKTGQHQTDGTAKDWVSLKLFQHQNHVKHSCSSH